MLDPRPHSSNKAEKLLLLGARVMPCQELIMTAKYFRLQSSHLSSVQLTIRGAQNEVPFFRQVTFWAHTKASAISLGASRKGSPPSTAL